MTDDTGSMEQLGKALAGLVGEAREFGRQRLAVAMLAARAIELGADVTIPADFAGPLEVRWPHPATPPTPPATRSDDDDDLPPGCTHREDSDDGRAAFLPTVGAPRGTISYPSDDLWSPGPGMVHTQPIEALRSAAHDRPAPRLAVNWQANDEMLYAELQPASPTDLRWAAAWCRHIAREQPDTEAYRHEAAHLHRLADRLELRADRLDPDTEHEFGPWDSTEPL